MLALGVHSLYNTYCVICWHEESGVSTEAPHHFMQLIARIVQQQAAVTIECLIVEEWNLSEGGYVHVLLQSWSGLSPHLDASMLAVSSYPIVIQHLLLMCFSTPSHSIPSNKSALSSCSIQHFTCASTWVNTGNPFKSWIQLITTAWQWVETNPGWLQLQKQEHRLKGWGYFYWWAGFALENDLKGV